VRQLLDAGAVPMVKTNIPMFLLTWESLNNLFGAARNPWDPSRTPGGSSGGEGTLVASKCSPGGIGSDIGSSVRAPASWCGLVGMKYTSSRVSTDGAFIPTPSGKTGAMVKASVGPMVRSVDDAITITKALIHKSSMEADGSIDFRPLNLERLGNFSDKLKIGYVRTIPEIFDACPSAKRGVDEAVKVIRSLGHEAVEFHYDFENGYKCFLDTLTCGEKVRDMLNLLNGEQYIDAYKTIVLALRLPRWALKMIGPMLWGDPTRFNKFLGGANSTSTEEMFENWHKQE
jgi:fatty acid amide hydrolase